MGFFRGLTLVVVGFVPPFVLVGQLWGWSELFRFLPWALAGTVLFLLWFVTLIAIAAPTDKGEG